MPNIQRRGASMTAGGAGAGPDPQSIVFSSFRLDLRGGRLTRAGTPIPLRPKTWAVLVYLAERPGVLVTKEELLDAVWPDVAVTPDTLTKSIGELRLALGDDATTPRFIETVHRRGFRFIGQTSTGAGVGRGSASVARPRRGHGAVRRPRGRAAAAGERFAKACAGERQIVFVTGPAGVGKTTLVEAFLESPAVHRAAPPVMDRARRLRRAARAARALHARARRRSDAWRAGRTRTGWSRLLRRVAPTWLAQMPWLIGDDEQALRQSLQAVRAERMLREFAALIEALTTDVTLVLVLEDLHWSDPSTVDLLSLLGQRHEPARLLVIGTYRPAEVAVQEHVLLQRCPDAAAAPPVHRAARARADAKRTCGATSRHAFPAPSSRPTLARLLHAHTDGNPLFVIAVVDAHAVARLDPRDGAGVVLQQPRWARSTSGYPTTPGA